ncbi:MAG: hypothetical protein KGL39_59240 [Patescibacteria group bacterium]|nr:hypothetical protein [Patescibacteria group bacterium]
MQAHHAVPDDRGPQTSDLDTARDWLDRVEREEWAARTLYRNARPFEARAFREQWQEAERLVQHVQSVVDDLERAERDGCDPDALYELRVVDARADR